MSVRAKSPISFDWEDVTDDSLPVIYGLQIATDEAFSANSIVLEESGIELSEYTVASEDRLNTVTQDAPYYWHVKAVDRAYNEGEWSDTRTFHVGFGMSLPQYVIYIIIIGAALLFAAFTFWLGRKTAYYWGVELHTLRVSAKYTNNLSPGFSYIQFVNLIQAL